ncbi:MAG: hypothetical protein QM723_37245 [Myxococcaceae bacterium]
MPTIEAKPYRVKTADGELTYGSLEEVKTAYVLGLIEADDEVLKEGETLWRKAGGIPLLVTAAKQRAASSQSTSTKYMLAAMLFGGLGGMYFLLKGNLGLGVGLSAIVVVVGLRMAITSGKVKKPS